MDENTRRIASLNDAFRKTGQGGLITKTQGIAALPVRDQLQILDLVQSFNEFSSDNDPHGEHEFGSIEHGGNKIFWKIDYYDKNMEQGSENPSDPKKTVRVMTIMLAMEY